MARHIRTVYTFACDICGAEFEGESAVSAREAADSCGRKGVPSFRYAVGKVVEVFSFERRVNASITGAISALVIEKMTHLAFYRILTKYGDIYCVEANQVFAAGRVFTTLLGGRVRVLALSS